MKTYLATITQDLKPKNRLQTAIQQMIKDTLHRVTFVGDFNVLLAHVCVSVEKLNKEYKRCTPVLPHGYNERNGDAMICFSDSGDSFLQVSFLEYDPKYRIAIDGTR